MSLARQRRTEVSVFPPEGARALATSPEQCRERGATGTMTKAVGGKHALPHGIPR